MLLTLFSLLFFTFSCAKDEQGIEPSVDEQGKPTIGFREAHPNPKTDCKCYMSVISVENIPLGQTDWTLGSDGDYGANNTGYEQNGILNTFQVEPGGQVYLPLPSIPRHVESGEFYVFSFAPSVNTDFTINTRVDCYLQHEDGSETLSSKTYHSYVWNEAYFHSGSTGYAYAVFDYSLFSCLYLTADQTIEFP